MDTKITFIPAERKKAKLRLGISGPAGSGKTASALLIAYGITNDWAKIGLVDTESGSGELYANTTIGGVNIGKYNVATITPPFEPQKYINAIKAAEAAGMEVVILDSISHAWVGEGGLLDTQGKVASKIGNSYTAWREVTPLHNKFVEAMLQSKIHVIATMRSKQEYALESGEKGKTIVRKLGMAPVQRDGMDYEFTVVFDLSHEHIASVSKDRTSLFDGKYFIPTPETGKQLKEWLESGKAEKSEEAKEEKPEETKVEKPETKKPEEGKVEKPAEKAVADTTSTEEKNIANEVILMGTPRKKNGQDIIGVPAVVGAPSEYEGEYELLAPLSFKDMLTNGAALIVEGSIIEGKLEAVSVKPIAGGEGEPATKGPENIITLSATPKPGIITYKGENLTKPFASCGYPGNYAAVFAVGEVLKAFAEGDILEVKIVDKMEKDGKLMLFISEAKKISSQQQAG